MRPWISPVMTPVKADSGISLQMASMKIVQFDFMGKSYSTADYYAADGILELRDGLFRDLLDQLNGIKDTYGRRSDEYMDAQDRYFEIQDELLSAFAGVTTRSASVFAQDIPQDSWSNSSPFGN